MDRRRIVDEHIKTPQSALDVDENLAHPIGVAHVELVHVRALTASLYALGNVVKGASQSPVRWGVRASSGQDDDPAFGRKRLCESRTYASRRACDESHSIAPHTCP